MPSRKVPDMGIVLILNFYEIVQSAYNTQLREVPLI